MVLGQNTFQIYGTWKHPDMSSPPKEIYSEKKQGEATFCYYAPYLWNKIPKHLRTNRLYIILFLFFEKAFIMHFFFSLF